MKKCPHCFSEIPSDNKSIYCPKCGKIIDENVLINEKITKQLKQGKTEDRVKPAPSAAAKPEPQHKKMDDDYERRAYQEEKKPWVPIVIGVAVVVVVACLFLFMK